MWQRPGEVVDIATGVALARPRARALGGPTTRARARVAGSCDRRTYDTALELCVGRTASQKNTVLLSYIFFFFLRRVVLCRNAPVYICMHLKI
jgi:hypothetical protein